MVLVLYHAKNYTKNDEKVKFDVNLMQKPTLLNNN